MDRNRLSLKQQQPLPVALRKESVDRNLCFVALKGREKLSLSARRAWIEIVNNSNMSCSVGVALRKESVDRNLLLILSFSVSLGRSPQGERG